MLRPRRSSTEPLRPRDPRPQGTLGSQRPAIFGKQRVGAAAGGLGRSRGDLPVELVDPRAQAEHVRMVRLHQRALLLILGLERGSALAQRLGARVTSAVAPASCAWR